MIFKIGDLDLLVYPSLQLGDDARIARFYPPRQSTDPGRQR